MERKVYSLIGSVGEEFFFFWEDNCCVCACVRHDVFEEFFQGRGEINAAAVVCVWARTLVHALLLAVCEEAGLRLRPFYMTTPFPSTSLTMYIYIEDIT